MLGIIRFNFLESLKYLFLGKNLVGATLLEKSDNNTERLLNFQEKNPIRILRLLFVEKIPVQQDRRVQIHSGVHVILGQILCANFRM
jgi:hypothetical protein